MNIILHKLYSVYIFG